MKPIRIRVKAKITRDEIAELSNCKVWFNEQMKYRLSHQIAEELHDNILQAITIESSPFVYEEQSIDIIVMSTNEFKNIRNEKRNKI